MTDRVFFVRGKFGESFSQGMIIEDRIVSETRGTPRFRGDRSVDNAADDCDNPAVPGQGHNANKPGPSSGGGNGSEQAQDFGDVFRIRRSGPGKPGGMNPRPALKGLDLQAGILGQGQETASAAVKFGLGPGVGRERFPRFRTDGVDSDVDERNKADRRRGERGGDLPGFSPVRRGDQERLVPG